MNSTIERDFEFCALGVTSKDKVVLQFKPSNNGINFYQKKEGSISNAIKAHASNVVNTMRNVVLGYGDFRICLVEHLLAGLALYGIDNIDIIVDGPEIPLGDGSCSVWIDLFEKNNIKRVVPESTIELPQALMIKHKNSQVIAIPDDDFSLSYLIDWPKYPQIGKKWQEFTAHNLFDNIGLARTFGTELEHQLMGTTNDLVTITANGFNKPLVFEDEPIRHKILDLLGDLSLCGVNPLKIKAKFISIRGGHTIDIMMALELAKFL